MNILSLCVYHDLYGPNQSRLIVKNLVRGLWTIDNSSWPWPWPTIDFGPTYSQTKVQTKLYLNWQIWTRYSKVSQDLCVWASMSAKMNPKFVPVTSKLEDLEQLFIGLQNAEDIKAELRDLIDKQKCLKKKVLVRCKKMTSRDLEALKQGIFAYQTYWNLNKYNGSSIIIGLICPRPVINDRAQSSVLKLIILLVLMCACWISRIPPTLLKERPGHDFGRFRVYFPTEGQGGSILLVHYSMIVLKPAIETTVCLALLLL